MMPVIKERSLAEKSSHLKVEHFIWKMPLDTAKAGRDLYSSAWAAITGAMYAAAHAIRIDLNNGEPQNDTQCARWTRWN